MAKKLFSKKLLQEKNPDGILLFVAAKQQRGWKKEIEKVLDVNRSEMLRY